MLVDTTRFAAATQRTATTGIRYLLLATVVSSTVLVGCTSRTTRAPVTDMSTAPTGSPTAVAGQTYVVKPGDTLYKIAQSSGVDVARLGQLNNITDPSQLRVGQVLRLDGQITAQPDTGTAVTAPVVAVPAVQPVDSKETARASDASVISWGWPTNGKIIQGFNASTKGIDLEGTPGDPVQAAADGKVMYAGNGVRGLGNLILLGHSNGFITAYAHNQELLVETGQDITKGTRIATVGQTDTTSPRLHFEVRRRGTPVDPLSYLPPR